MKHNYTYRAVNGDDIRCEFSGDVATLRREHANSSTPISSIDGVPEDLTQFVQLEIDGINRVIDTLQMRLTSLVAEQMFRRQLKRIVGRPASR